MNYKLSEKDICEFTIEDLIEANRKEFCKKIERTLSEYECLKGIMRKLIAVKDKQKVIDENEELLKEILKDE